MFDPTPIISVLFGAIAVPVILNFVVLAFAEKKYQG
jgi:hypothetical protein